MKLDHLIQLKMSLNFVISFLHDAKEQPAEGKLCLKI